MRLKEIKPGMAVKCRTKEEATVLWTWFFDNGYVRLGMDADGLDNFLRCISDSRYGINKNGNSWGTYGENDEDIEKIEFSDLIIPELSAEEVLQICAEICNESECLVCPLGEEHCFNDKDTDKSGIVAICEKWKSDHEKKEPEIEWVFKGVADIVGCNEIEFFVSDEAAMEWCERRTLETGNNHAYVPVCRVKAVE